MIRLLMVLGGSMRYGGTEFFLARKFKIKVTIAYLLYLFRIFVNPDSAKLKST